MNCKKNDIKRTWLTCFASWVCIPGFFLHDKSICWCKTSNPSRNFAESEERKDERMQP